jgi:hypothetical protein
VLSGSGSLRLVKSLNHKEHGGLRTALRLTKSR